VQARAAQGGAFRFGNRLAQARRQAVAAAEDGQPNPRLCAVDRFGAQVFIEQRQDAVHFRARANPVGRRKGEQSERVNTQARSRFDDGTRRLSASAMSGRARQSAGSGPAPVAVGDDGDAEARHWRGKREWRVLDLHGGLCGHGVCFLSGGRRNTVNYFS
jgi:hypothetical protein